MLPELVYSEDQECDLNHSLQPYFSELVRFRSSRQLEKSELFEKLKPQIERILQSVVVENFSPQAGFSASAIRATAWNIERGMELDRILEVLQTHPVLSRSDLLFLTELDYGMARTRNRNIAREIAQALQMNYAFAPSYINLEKGSGLESEVEGHNRYGLHGNGLFSRFPMRDARSIALPNGKDKMKGKEKRLGSQRAVAATVLLPQGRLQAVSVHLDAHSTQKHRMQQMRLILDDLEHHDPQAAALIGGDWNTSTYNSRNSLFSILGYTRRVLMGVRRVIQQHYPHPDRWFERHLFRELERRGFRYRDLNEPAGCTLHYSVDDLAANGRMADWIPNWCFWFINWALQKNDGRCSMKLDWFAGKRIQALGDSPPRVLGEVHDRRNPLSDHDPIVLDFSLVP